MIGAFQAGVLQSGGGVVYQTLWYDTFTEAANTPIVNHTPNIGSGYPTGKSISNTTLVTNNANMLVVAGSDVLAGNATGGGFGPVFNVGATRSRTSFVVAGISGTTINWRYAFRVNYALSNRGWKVGYTPSATPNLTILDDANTNRGTVNITLSVGDKITIEDDGTNNATWLKVYVNDVLIYTSAVASTAITNTERSWWSGTAGVRISELLIKEY